MRNLTKIFLAVVAGMFAFSCVTDTTEDLGVKVEGNKGGVYEVSISLEEATKTQLGEKVDGVYPLYWSEGDAIAINGVVSAPLTGVAANSDAATFTFSQPVAAPFCVVYPAPAAVAVEDEVVEEPAAPVTVYPVTFAATQPYTAGTFASGVAPMYGYAAAAAEGEEQPAIALQHLTGVLRLAIKGNGEKVTGIKVQSEKGAIAGAFTVDCANGALTALEGASNVVNVTFAEGLVLGAEAQVVYVAVPAGDYGTFLITVATEAHEKMTLKFNSSIKPINAGAVREFAEFAYEANLADTEEATFLIDSYESLVAFAKIAPSFYPRNNVKVTADIDMTGKEWTPIEYFGEYEFDGGNFEIKGLSAPLFNKTAAHIKDLKLTDINYTVTDLAKSGAIVCELYGSIDNCSVSGAITINNTTFEGPAQGNYGDVAHAGVVGMAHNATITNCVNNAKVTVISFCKSDFNVKCNFGGVVGGFSDKCTFNNLTNNGDITYAGTTLLGNLYFAGVIGKNDDSNGQLDYAAISNCTNNGKISTTAESVCGTDLIISGVTGRLDAGADLLVENLVNNGAVTVAGKSKGARAAGIAGYTSSATLKNCHNTGAISVAATAQFNGSVYVSGLISAAITTEGIDNCYNTGAITVADGVTFNKILDVNGVFNTVTGSTGESLITNVTNSGAIKVGKVINENKTAEGNDERMYVGGLFHQTTCGTFKNCYNEATGTVTVDVKKWASRLMSGGFQAYQSYNTKGVTIENCENRAALNYNPESLESAAIGGIASEYYAPTDHTGIITYKSVVNKGNITVTGTVTTSGYPRLGGIIGLDNGPGMILDGCVNEADITINTTNTPGPQIGGIMGADTNKKAVTIKNCENKGHINIVGVMTNYIRMGGILGNKSTNTPTTITGCVNSGTLTVSGEQTKTGNAYAIGGIVGYVYTNGLTISDCTNGVLNDTTGKGAITLGTAPGGYGAGGILGMFGVDAGGKVVHVNDCVNYAAVKQTGKGGGSGRGCLGGVVGTALGDKNKTSDELYIDGCENYGAIEYGTVTCGDRISIGGIIGEPQQYTYAEITNCKNGGPISFKAKGCGKEISFGGIAGMLSSSQKITDCVNLATGTVTSSGDSTSNFEFGGIAGSTSGAGTQILRCVNYAEIKQTVISQGTTQIGGCIGYGYSFGKYDDLHNYGAITVKGSKSSAQLSAGGVIGYTRWMVANGEAYVTNCYNHVDITLSCNGNEKYYAGGVIGYDRAASAENKGCIPVLDNLVNVGNVTFTKTSNTAYYGGLIGAANNVATNSKFYGDITAIGLEGKVGALYGKARTDAIKVTNSAAGGNIIYSTATEEDANGDQVTYGVKTPIDLTMLYPTAIAASVAEGDGCSLLTSKPAVPATPAPAPAPEPAPAE